MRNVSSRKQFPVCDCRHLKTHFHFTMVNILCETKWMLNSGKNELNWFEWCDETQFIIAERKEQTLNSCMDSGIRKWFKMSLQIKWKDAHRAKSVNNNGGKKTNSIGFEISAAMGRDWWWQAKNVHKPAPSFSSTDCFVCCRHNTERRKKKSRS